MNFTSSEWDYVKDNEAYVPVAESEKRRIGSIEELERALAVAKAAGDTGVALI